MHTWDAAQRMFTGVQTWTPPQDVMISTQLAPIVVKKDGTPFEATQVGNKLFTATDEGTYSQEQLSWLDAGVWTP